MKVEELLKLDQLRPSELCRLVGIVTIFTSEKADDEYHWGVFHGKVKVVSMPRVGDEQWSDTLHRIQAAVKAECEKYPALVYTGIRKENDWSRSYGWDKGWHLCNRTGDYAVVNWTRQAPECGVDCQCPVCR